MRIAIFARCSSVALRWAASAWPPGRLRVRIASGKLTLMDRYDYQRWEARGGTTFQERANKKVRSILESHRCERLPADLERALDELVNG